jgi:hypothetical protein
MQQGDYEPVVRVVRKTEASNPLLQRVVLGKSKRSTYSLPSAEFVYGNANQQDSEGCAEVLSTWVEHHANPDSVPGRDFMALNKRATISKMTTATDVTAFRKAHDIRLKRGDTMNYSSSCRALPSDINPSHVYGKPNRPSTPIADVVQAAYECDWVDQQMHRRAAKEQQDKQALEKMRNPDTAASRGHAIARQIKPPTKQPFIMKKFKNVGARTHFPK